ncbi:MAG TPA: flavin reductase family protein [Lachnospiraceae bacterium]|nr:flavin reductase family protein [Lachnospiraceae bacterium]
MKSDYRKNKHSENKKRKDRDKKEIKLRGKNIQPGRTGKRSLKHKETGVSETNGPVNKISFEKPGNFLYPLPAVMVSCAGVDGKPNIITVAWAGTVCTNPPMLSVSIRKERYSYDLIRETGEFVVNLTNRKLAGAADYCGCRSGRDHDKFAECCLTPGKSEHISAPSIQEAPVSIECKVRQVIPLGSHDMFLAEVLGIQVDAGYMDEKKTLHLENADLITYSHGKYFTLGNMIGTFGYSVRRKK